MTELFRNSTALRFSPSENDFATTPLHQLSWGVTDIGTTHGVILVERFRTFANRLPNLERHWNRFNAGANHLRFELPLGLDTFRSMTERLLELNSTVFESVEDASLVVLASPGDIDFTVGDGATPTCMLHLSPLDFGKLASWYTHGATVSLGKHRNVPDTCWSNSIKSRSRIHYYLSDKQVAEMDPKAIALLLNSAGVITDASVANVLVVSPDGAVYSPHHRDILPGCSLAIATEILRDNNIHVIQKDLLPSDLQAARELILTGSSGCVWAATRYETSIIGDGKIGEVCRLISQEWIRRIGFDFQLQAIRQNRN